MRGLPLALSCLPALLAGALLATPPAQARSAAPLAAAATTGSMALPVREENARPHRGEASFYHDRFHGREMANGETFRQESDSAASRTLPLGTRAQVRNLENGRTAEVTIEDRGPYARGRVIDLSKSTARKLDMMEDGTAPVEVRPLPGNRQD
ncbi:septal ring lytic transglycosylase RlpA family protein [Teichococcus aestuarii]|uniref:septal ring lytic transglycosylase RlpA family protein n=1 Tax=Teichococcus aestuarii TaxID=568898 RepID=UPI00361B0599